MSDQDQPRQTIELDCTFSLAPKNTMCLRTELGTAEGDGRNFMISMSGGALVVEEQKEDEIGRHVSISFADILNQGVKAIDCLSTVERLLEDHGAELEGREADMDELVHDAVSHEGSDTNNQGLRAQILFLAEELGAAEAERLVKTTFELAGT